MGRAHHLKQTLPKNIADNPSAEGLDVEFVVLNYNSQDDLHEWMNQDPQILKWIDQGVIRYGRTLDPGFFHMAHAKNMAHRLATGDVLCNLDADNYTGHGFASFLKTQYSDNMNIIISPSHRVSRLYPPQERGFGGKISISARNFYRLGGYDETYQGWGGEDNDFTQRAKGFGLPHFRIEGSDFVKIIPHTNEERARNMRDSHSVLQRINILNCESPLIKAWRRVGVVFKPVQANQGTHFGMGRVKINSVEDLVFAPIQSNTMSPFNVCARGLPELVRGRINPRIATIDETDCLNAEP